MILLCYQSLNAVNMIMYPPLMVTTSQANIDDVTPPLMHLCPLEQYDLTKLHGYGYTNENDLLEGILENKTYRSWGSNFNMTFEQLVRNVTVFSPENFMADHKLDDMLQPVLYPKYGFCFEVKSYDSGAMLLLPKQTASKKNFTILLTSRSTKRYFHGDSNSQFGDRVYINTLDIYSYKVDIEMYESAESRNCVADPDYSYEKCVDEFIRKDLKEKIGCTPPYLSSSDHCSIVPETYNKELAYFGIEYANNYYINGENIAEKTCLQPCKQQRVKLTLKDQSPEIEKDGSWAMFTFNPTVRVNKEIPSYNWFSFTVDIGKELELFQKLFINYCMIYFVLGSSLGTWAGLSAISCIDLLTINPMLSFKTWLFFKET